MNRHGPGRTMGWLKPWEKSVFSKCPAGGQEKRNFPKSRTKVPGVGVRACRWRGALEERHRRRKKEPGDRKQQREMLQWCRSSSELGCSDCQVQKKLSEGRGKHLSLSVTLPEMQVAGKSSSPPCRTLVPNP